MQCYIIELVVGISSAEVVPFIACRKLALGACRNGATFAGRNPQSILLVTEITEYLFFR